MKAVVFNSFGGPDVLEVRDVPIPTLGPGQLLVRVYAAGANPIDAQTRVDGSWAGITLPGILGCDISGVVESVGEGVLEFAPGDDVFYMAEFLGGSPGGYAELNVVDAAIVAPKPAQLTHIEAASLPVAAGTARVVAWERLDLQPGDWVMMHGASGGVGGYAVQLAKARGARIIASASAKRHEYLRALGADATIDYSEGDPFEEAAQIAGRKLDAVADFVGNGAVAKALPFVREFGRVATIVELQGDLDLAIDRNIALHGVLVRPSRTLLEDISRHVERGELRPLVDTVYRLDQVQDLHRRLDSGHAQGKAVLALPVLARGSS